MKKLIIILITIGTCIVLSGCWDKVEIDKRSFISTIGIDAGENIGDIDKFKKLEKDKSNNEIDLKKITVTFGAPDISKLGPQKSASAQDLYLTTDAISMEDALDKASAKMSRDINYGHVRLLILSSELLENPNTVIEIVDYFQRQASVNKMMYVMVAQGKAEDYVKFKPSMEQNIETYISGLMENSKRNGSILPVTLNELLIRLSENKNGIIPSLKYDKDKKEMILTGVAVIKDYKIKGYLSQNETSDIEMLRGNLKGGKKSIYVQGHPIDISIEDIRRKITMSNSKDKLNFRIDVFIEAQIKGYYSGAEQFTNEYISSIENSFNKSIEDECNQAIKITQDKFSVDPIGFREHLEKYHPYIWKSKKDNWEETYKSSVINVNIHTKIRRIGVSK